MSQDVYGVLYFLYGFTFVLMGIYAVRAHQKNHSIFPLTKAIVFLGVFGIVHGVTEWFTMLQRFNVFEAHHALLFVSGRVLKAMSFLALAQFGFILLFKPFLHKLSTVLIGVYFTLFLVALSVIISHQGLNYVYENRLFFMISVRYLMAFPAAIISSVVLIIEGLKVRKLDVIWMKYYFYLGGVVFIYGLLDGLFVRRADFFPANTFYNQWFLETLGLPIQLFKIIIGLMFIHSIQLVIKSFTWEKERKWQHLKTTGDTLRAKQLLNQQLHDEVIQSLYISGLNLDAMKDRCPNDETKAVLINAISMMNDTIEMLRSFIRNHDDSSASVRTIHDTISEMIETTFQSTDIEVDYVDFLDEQGIQTIDQAVLENLYYILRELLVNILKHAHATHVKIVLYQEIECIKLTVTDNGRGFSRIKVASPEQLGLNHIYERLNTMQGALKIYSRRKWACFPSSTRITVFIPSWEVLK